MNEITVDNNNSIKVIRTLPFDVVAVPQTNISQMSDTAKNTIPKPVNIKIKVKNKEEMSHGLGVTIPKFSTTGPKKVRLISSDQTIISFDLFMEKENEKKVPKKPHCKFFKLFKPSGCLSNQNDDDVYPYLPNSCNETYRAKSTSYVNELQDNKTFEDKFALKKNLSPVISTNTIRTNTIRTPTFLGKCKPGGCLDPPFGEDKYIYKPKHKILAIDQKDIEEQDLDTKYSKDSKNIDKSDTSSQISLNKCSLEKIYSHSLITYPPALSSNKIQVKEKVQNKKSKLITSSENKGIISFNEFSDTYFMPPKKQKNKNDEKLSIEFTESSNIRDNSCNTKSKTEIDSLTSQKKPVLLSTNEPFNEVIEPKILNPLISECCQKSNNSLLNDDKNATIGVLSDTDIKIQILKVSPKVSSIELNLINDTAEKKMNSLATAQTNYIISSEDPENHYAKIKTDVKLYNTNLDNLSITKTSLIYKNTMITENVPITAKDSQMSIVENNSNEILYKLKPMPNKLVDNHLIASQEYLKLKKTPKENLFLTPNCLDSNIETKMNVSLISSDEATLTSSQTVVTEHLPEIADNLLQISLTKNNELDHSNGQLIQHKQSGHASIKEQIKDRYISDMHQKRSFQDVDSTSTIIRKEKSDTNKNFIKQRSDKIEDENNDQNLATLLLSEAKSIRISSEVALTDLISTKSYESNRKPSALIADLETDRNNMILNNIYSKIETQLPTALQEKVCQQMQEKDNNNLIHHANKNSLDTHQIVKVTSSLNLTTPQALPEKISSILQTHDKDTSKEDPVNSKNKISLATSQVLKLSSNLSHKTTTPTDNFEIHSSDDPVEIQNLKNIDIVSYDGISTGIVEKHSEESVDKNPLKIKRQLQINNNKVTSIPRDNEVAKYDSTNIVAFFNETLKNQSENISKDYPDFYQGPLNLNIPEIYAASFKEIEINNDKVNVTKSEEENTLGNKNSLIVINLGFQAYVNDKNETIIKTFDTSEHLRTDPQAKITIIESMFRKNDSEIRIPVNSEMDLTLQIKNLNKVNISKQDIDDINKVTTDNITIPYHIPRKPFDKDILLQETLASVYENLVPVENIIRNLKQETDVLTQQQVLLREMLNAMKTTSVKIINTNNKMCTCNKYSM